MPTHTEIAIPSEKSERAPRSAPPRVVVASPGNCPICGTPLQGRQKRCSGRCRAALSRRRRIAVKAEELRDHLVVVRDVLDWLATVEQAARTAQGRLWEAKEKLEEHLGG